MAMELAATTLCRLHQSNTSIENEDKSKQGELKKGCMTTQSFSFCFDGTWLLKDVLTCSFLVFVVYFEDPIQVLVMLSRVLPYLTCFHCSHFRPFSLKIQQTHAMNEDEEVWEIIMSELLLLVVPMIIVCHSFVDKTIWRNKNKVFWREMKPWRQ